MNTLNILNTPPPESLVLEPWRRRHILQHKGGSVEALLLGQKRSRVSQKVVILFLFSFFLDGSGQILLIYTRTCRSGPVRRCIATL
jgi:hypothetical protein